jgi:hypothetical protein
MIMCDLMLNKVAYQHGQSLTLPSSRSADLLLHHLHLLSGSFDESCTVEGFIGLPITIIKNCGKDLDNLKLKQG